VAEVVDPGPDPGAGKVADHEEVGGEEKEGEEEPRGPEVPVEPAGAGEDGDTLEMEQELGRQRFHG
jgi:hypothetical protein